MTDQSKFSVNRLKYACESFQTNLKMIHMRSSYCLPSNRLFSCIITKYIYSEIVNRIEYQPFQIFDPLFSQLHLN